MKMRLSQQEIDRIRIALGNDDKSFYVYMLCENINGQNKPFYIGKGIGDRVLQHELSAEKEISDRILEVDKFLSYDKSLTDKERKIKKSEQIEKIKKDISKKNQKIGELGAENVIKVIVKWGLTENEAFMAESALINAYSFTESRDSLTNVVNGHMSEREKSAISCTTKARTLQEFLDECAAPQKVVTEINESVIFLKIKSLYPQCMQQPKAEQEKAIYDSCRACWILDKSKINKIKYVFALYNSQVVGIYKVSEESWKQRSEIDDTFPSFPSEIRRSEIYYSNIAQNCRNLSEMKYACENPNEFLRVSHIDEDDDNGFRSWKNRYYFNKIDDDIPENIMTFKNCILIKPNGEKFFSGRGNQSEKMYNFYIKNDTTIIKKSADYEK